MKNNGKNEKRERVRACMHHRLRLLRNGYPFQHPHRNCPNLFAMIMALVLPCFYPKCDESSISSEEMYEVFLVMFRFTSASTHVVSFHEKNK